MGIDKGGNFNENSNPGGTLNVIKLGSWFLPWVLSKAFLLQISGEHSKPLYLS